MPNIYVVEGGIGREIFFSALIPKLAELSGGEIMTCSSYTDIYENHPLVSRSYGRGTPYVWTDVIKKDDVTVKFADPYFNSDFIKGKIHVIEAWCREFGIEYSPDMKPQLYLSSMVLNDAKRFKKENGEFIVIQFSSGQSPLGFNPQQPFNWVGFQREYPLELAQQFVNKFHEQYPDMKIVLYGLPNEFTNQLEGVVKLNAPYLAYAGLLTEAKGFVGINSSLMHFAGALDVKGVCLWGGSSPKQWGYDIHTHLNGECSRNELFCTRPYLRDLGDFVGNGQKWFCPKTSCMNINPDLIVTELGKIINKIII